MLSGPQLPSFAAPVASPVAQPHRTTPTEQLVAYPSSDGSASNQSPPATYRNHALIQTDETGESVAEERRKKDGEFAELKRVS